MVILFCYIALTLERIQDRTRFSMLTGDRAESSIHDFIPEDQDDTTSARGRDIVELKAQLDNILEHVWIHSNLY